MTVFIGNNPEQVPLNGTLGNMAFQNKERVNVTGGTLTGVTINNPTVPALNNTVIANGTLADTVESVGTSTYNIASQYDVGTAPNQIPLNQYLGTMAYQDATHVNIGILGVGVGPFTTNQPLMVRRTSSGTVALLQADGNSTLVLERTSVPGDPGSASFVVTNGGALNLDTSGLSVVIRPAGVEAARFQNGTGNFGLGTNNPTNILSIGGNSARTIWMERHTTANTAGNNLTVQSGGATSGATDKNGGTLLLQSGTATGSGSSIITFSTATAGGAGTTDRPVTEKMRIDGDGNVGIGTSSPTFGTRLHVFTANATSRLSIETNGATSGSIVQLISVSNTVTLNNRGDISQFLIDSPSFDVGIRTTGAKFLYFSTNSIERMRIDSAGNVGVGTASPTSLLTVAGPAAFQAPATKTANYNMVATDSALIFNGTGSITLTLQAASSYTGRMLYVKTIAAQTVVSASSNVVPIDSATAGTAILAATAGKWAILQSDGTNWVVIASN